MPVLNPIMPRAQRGRTVDRKVDLMKVERRCSALAERMDSEQDRVDELTSAVATLQKQVASLKSSLRKQESTD